MAHTNANASCEASDLFSVATPQPRAGPWIASRRRKIEPLAFSPEALLLILTTLAIKLTLFHINVLITSFTFPVWLLYSSLFLVSYPFRAMKLAGDGAKKRLVSVGTNMVEKASPELHSHLSGVATRLVRGCFWSVYVFFVVSGLLAAAFVAGTAATQRVVEEPVSVARSLNFDYTRPSPEAVVALGPDHGASGGWDYGGMFLAGVWMKQSTWRFVRPEHKLQLVVSLTLPESDYNRKLGIFQVKAEFLSNEGNIISTWSHPCMLRFKSTSIRFIETFFKSVPIVVGYSSESQVLKLPAITYVERVDPVTYIRVVLEQRAEFHTGSGIPEIYAASLALNSELSLHKRILWNCRLIVLLCISSGVFMVELSVVLVCCTRGVFPRTKRKHV